MPCPIVVWDGFGEAIAFLIGYYKVAQEIGSEFVPQNSPRMQFNSIGSSSAHDSDGGKTATATKTLLKKRIRAAANFFALIPSV